MFFLMMFPFAYSVFPTVASVPYRGVGLEGRLKKKSSCPNTLFGQLLTIIFALTFYWINTLAAS
jgi:hypothetical protein